MKKIHYTEKYSKSNNQWNYNLHELYWVGGRFKVNNLSKGYHGILKQWWEHYKDINKQNDILLVSEGNKIKNQFETQYPNWCFKTTDMFYDLQSEPDIISDICKENSLPEKKFDIIICQATLEHVYNPFNAIDNFQRALKPTGILLIHTHPPDFQYHSYPRDYFRFMKDFWYDIPKWNNNLELIELYMLENKHVFTAYIKI